MIVCHAFAGRRIAVFGLARSGLSSARSLLAGGAEVAAWDDGEEARRAAQELGIPIVDLYQASWRDYAALVLAPGVPLTHPKPHPIVKLARKNKISVIGDIELFARELKIMGADRPKVIGVTGTNGKSTTTALITHMLKTCGLSAHACGNIGAPLLDAPAPKPRTVYVIELSSYQLDLTRSLEADVAVLLNISPDHLDRHGTMEDYIAAKMHIFDGQGVNQCAVIGVDDPYSQAICTQIAARKLQSIAPISVGKAVARGAYVIDGMLYDVASRPSAEVVDLKRAEALPGAHNWQNAAAAFAACRPLVDNVAALGKSILSFPGLEHRLQIIERIGKVRFVNDSKATNAEAAAHALAAFDSIFWIAGGRAKQGGIDILMPQFGRVAKAYLIGEAANAFDTTLGDRVAHEICGTLDKAVTAAARDAALADGNPVVLLSPACSSFDQYTSFEDRGEAFVGLVRKLKVENGRAVKGESAA